MDQNTVAFALLTGLLGTYAVMDGFDLGVGTVSLLARSKEERDLHVAAIGPTWDGNEVWLLTSANVLLGVFTPAFAVVFNGFYVALMLALIGLVVRAVAIEYRLGHSSSRWVTSQT